MWKLLSLAGAAAAACSALRRLTWGVHSTKLLEGVAFFPDTGWGRFLFPALCAAAVLWFARGRERRYEYAFRPFWLLLGVFIWPEGSSAVFCYALAVFVWGILRLGAGGGLTQDLPEIPGALAKAGVGLLTAGAVIWSFLLQCAAFDSWFLIFGDWGQYSECYLRLASGGGSVKELLCAAGHFNVLVNLVMTGALWVFRSPRTVFFVNSLAIASAVPLCFLLARKNGLNRSASLLMGVCAALFPVFTRQYLCLFYGFHPIVFFIPALLAFFVCRSAGSRWGMGLCIGLSLLIQETVAVFWAGWGLYLLAVERKYRKGAILLLLSGVWFAFLACLVQPWAGGGEVYGQSFHYSALGATPLEALLSPFLRPGAFWGSLFSPRGLFFTAVLLTPVWAAVLAFPGILLAGLPLLAGVLLQSSDAVKTPLLQYGVELSTLLLAAAIINLGRLRRGECPLLRGRGNVFRGTLLATAAGIGLGYLFFGFGFKFWLYPGDLFLHGPDASKAVAFLKKNLPERPARILATGRLRTHFMFDYPTAPLTEGYREGDFLIIDLHDPAFEDMAKIEALRRRLCRDPRTRPVTHVNWYGKQIVMLRIVPKETPHRILCPVIAEELFRRAGGREVASGIDGIRARCDGRALHFRIDRELPCDYDVFIDLKFPDGKVKTLEYAWYFGLFPAWSQKPGTLWSVPLPSGFSAVGIRFKVRPGSGPFPSGAGEAPATTPAAAGKSSAPPR